MHLPTWFYYLVIAGFGLIFGSFFNVVIYRLPRGESLGSRSRCPECSRQIKWYDNVPLLSFALLKGKCRGCGGPISWRYPVVELMTGALFAICYLWSRQVVPALVTSPSHPVTKGQPLVPELFIGLIAVSVLVIATGTDLSDGVVPNEVTYAGSGMMILLVIGLAVFRGQPGRIGTSFLAAFILGAGYLAASLVAGAWVYRRTGYRADLDYEDGGPPETEGDGVEADEEELPPMGGGMGDVKLLFFIGLAVGYFHWYLFFLVFLWSAVLGLLGIIVTSLLGKHVRRKIRFAPYLAAGGLLTLFLGQQMVDLYLKLLS